jgi:hypothetical protein
MEISLVGVPGFALGGDRHPADRRAKHRPNLRAAWGRSIAACLLLAVLVPSLARAQSGNPPAGSAQPAKMPVSVEQALYLIRSTLLTLHDANRTNNYTVLRDLASPDLQAKNTAADLSQVFADLRQRKADLSGVALAAPQLTSAPSLDANGMLRLVGYFPTSPLQIDFVLLFQNVEGRWRIFALSVSTPPAPQPASAPAKAKEAPQRKPN